MALRQPAVVAVNFCRDRGPAGLVSDVMDARQLGDGEVCGGDRYRTVRLAALVRDHRRAAGLTQGQLASLSGVSRAAVRDLEQGRTHRPRPGSLARLAGALGLDAIQADELVMLARVGGRPMAGAAGVGGPKAAGGLRLEVLGPLVAWRDGVRLALGGPRQQAVLGLLALEPGSLVHRSAIIDALWPTAPPPTAVSAVQSHISRLRALLAGRPARDGDGLPDRGRRPRDGRGPVDHGPPRDGRGPVDRRRPPDDSGALLVSAGASYSLRAGPDELDLLAFGQLAEDARAARRAGDVPGACELYERALELWRGAPLAGVDLLAGHPALATLARQRAEMVIEFARVASAAGWHERALSPLQALAAREPLNERAHAQLMIALAGCGQQAEALGLFEDLRARLDAELAMPPGPDLAEAHLRVLRQQIPPAAPSGAAAAPNDVAGQEAGTAGPDDQAAAGQGAAAVGAAALAGPREPTAGRGAPPVPRQLPAVPRQLPAGVRHFVGRAEEIGKLSALAEEAAHAAGPVVISAIGGTAGVGKTALALHWAHQIAGKFPDGQLYVNLRGFGPSGTPAPPGEAIRGFLDALGVPPESIPAALNSQAALYRSLLAGKRMLIILDNARDDGQVRPLLPGSPGTLVLVTSRHQLSGLVAAEGAHAITLDMLTDADAHDLLARRLGPERVAAEPGPAAELVGLCARLPLALAVIAARAVAHPNFPLAALAAELRAERGRLAALDANDPATNVRAAFSWSYRQLTPEAARMFRLLGLHPGPDISAPAAASLTGRPGQETRDALTELTAAHLLTEPVPDRFTCHDLLRAYAAEQAHILTSHTERRAALHRMLGHYLHSARAADRWLYPARRSPIDVDPPAAGTTPEQFAGHAQALAWFDAEHQVLLAAIGLAAAEGFDACAWQLPWAMETFFNHRDHQHDWAATERIALAAAGRLGDRNGQAYAHRSIATALLDLGDDRGVHAHLRQAMVLRRRLGDRAGQARLLMDFSRLYERQGRLRPSLSHARQALGKYRELGDRQGEAVALNHVGWALGLLGEYGQALVHCQQALVILVTVGDRHNTASTLDSLGYAHRHLGHHGQAAACYRRAVDLFAELGSRYKRAVSLGNAGDAHYAAGDLLAARDAWQESLAIVDELRLPGADQLRAKLQALATGAPSGRASSPPLPAAARR